MPELKNYTVINRPMVQSFARQLGLPIDQERTRGRRAYIDAKAVGASADMESNKASRQSAMPSDDPRLLEPIVESLRESDQLRVFRPEKLREFELADPPDWYVYEVADATPMLVPIKKIARKTKYLPDKLRVWVIDPIEPSREPVAKWEWLGAYVFLVDMPGDLEAYRFGITGVSALRLVVDVLATTKKEQNLTELGSTEDIFGRWHEGHPVEKLE
jgi:hypothetical protein